MKLKKIASLALAGVMAVSMLTACGEGASSSQPTEPTEPTTAGYSSTFQSALSTEAGRKITMSDSNALNQELAAAAQNISSATVIDFTAAIRAAGGVRTIANFDRDGNVYIADVPAGDAIQTVTTPWLSFDLVTGTAAADLGVVANKMDAVNVDNAFNALVPTAADRMDKTVTMVFAVDGFIGANAAVEQVAEVLDSQIRAMQVDNDLGTTTDSTTLNYSYTGSVSLMNRTLTDNHGMGINLIAVEITRTAKA